MQSINNQVKQEIKIDTSQSMKTTTEQLTKTQTNINIDQIFGSLANKQPDTPKLKP